MLRNLFLMETETICLLKRDLNSWSRSTKWNLSTLALVSISNKLMLSELELEDAHHGYVESRREQVRLQEELVMKQKALRDTQIRSIHEMWEMKRAEELRVDEFSVQKLRESHDTIQRLTSQIQELQERMNCMNDSGEFQDVELNYVGNLSHVPSQLAVIPSPPSMPSCDKRLPLDTWDTSGSQENVFGNPRSVHYNHLITEIFTLRHQGLQVRLQCKEAQGHLSQEVKNELGARPQCRCLKEGRQPWIPFWPEENPQTSKAGQQRQQISELQFDKFSAPSTFLCDSKPRWLLVPIFPRMPCCGPKKWRWSIQWMNF